MSSLSRLRRSALAAVCVASCSFAAASSARADDPTPTPTPIPTRTPTPTPTQNNDPVTTPSNVTASNITQTGATISWGASSAWVGIKQYAVVGDGVPYTIVHALTTDLTGLAPGTTYTVNVTAQSASYDGYWSDPGTVTFTTLAVGATPGPQRTPTPLPTVTPTPTPPATPTPTPVPNATYSVSGSMSLKNLVKGTVPLSGTLSGYQRPDSSEFVGDLTLAPVTANLKALGFLPVVAKINFVQYETVAAHLSSTDGNLSIFERFKLPSITTFGLQIAGGSSCQTTQPSIIVPTSVGAFSAAAGGTMAATFAMSNLAGCGVLNGIISPLTAGSGNTILLKLTPQL